MPVCTVAQAMALAGKAYINVAASGNVYAIDPISTGSFVIVGPGRDLTGSDAATFGKVVVSGAASLVLSGIHVTVTTPGIPAVQCSGSGASIYVLNSVISSDAGRGVDGGCGKVVVERSRVNSERSAIYVGTRGSYRIVNTAVSATIGGGTGTEPFAVILDDAAVGYFAFNTVTRYIGGVTCVSFSQTLEDSIIAGNAMVQVGNCDIAGRRVHTGAVTFVSATPLEPKLVDNATNAACCIDKGQKPEAGEIVPTDHYGTPRPLGPAYDIGYHELR